MTTTGLNENTRILLQSVFQDYPQIEEVRIFGSRAMNTHQDHSDIDLVIGGEIDVQTLGKLKLDLEDLPLAQMIDIQVYNQITHTDLKQHIDHFGKKIYQRHTNETVKDTK